MRNSIIEKLNKHLTRGIDRESDVVYLLIEIGKFLEQEQDSNYKLLKFYRNWIAHSQINKVEPIDEFSYHLEKLIDDIVTKQTLDVFETASEEISKFIDFKKLFTELGKFMHINGLPISFIKNTGNRIKFSKLLISILSDVPLIFSPEKFKHLRTFAFKKISIRSNIKKSLATWYIKSANYKFQGPVFIR